MPTHKGPTGGYRNRIYYAIGPTGGYRKGIHIRKASPIHNEILIHTVLLVVIEDPYTPISTTGRYRKASLMPNPI